MNRLFFTFLLVAVMLQTACDNTPAPLPEGPLPSQRQLEWQLLEFYAFVHFNINTFTGMEWGTGGEDPGLFNPTALDCRQWARVCKEAGMKGIIITAKHHDGFCLWPSAFTEHSVKNSPWKEGKGDVIRELSDACREYGLKFGVYLSPWDRNHADYGHPEYIPYFRDQLRELLTNYGEIFEVWFDGANGGTGWYGGANENRVIDARTYYDWENSYKIIRELQPNAVIFSDATDIRWVGNEEGWARPTNWSIIHREAFINSDKRDLEILRSGQADGTDWTPAEVDVSIRPGWYYHPSEDHQVKSLSRLLDIYYESVGRNGSLLLNLPVDKRGLVHENDAEALKKLSAALKADFAVDLAAGKQVTDSNVRGNSKKYKASRVNDSNPETYWAPDDSVIQASLILDMGGEVTFNRFLVQEYIPLGQRVKKFRLEALVNGIWQTLAEETTIGYKRILRFPETVATQIRFTITDAKACPLIANLQVFNAPKVLELPDITRNKEAYVTLRAADAGTDLFYTLDGSEPSPSATRYDSAFALTTRGEIRAVAVDPLTGYKSPVAIKQFDIPATRWTLLGPLAEYPKAGALFDGNPQTAMTLLQPLPVDFVIDLGEVVSLKGFTYLPDQGRWNPGVIRTYEFYISQDGKSWGEPVSSNEFGNITNSPVLQQVNFPMTSGRFLKFRAITDASGEQRAGIAEFTVITE